MMTTTKSRLSGYAILTLCFAVVACGGGADRPGGATEPPGGVAASPTAGSTAGVGADGNLPPGHPTGLQRSHPSTLTEAAAVDAPGTPRWEVPEGWNSEQPSSRMRKAQYRIPAAAGDAEGGECAVFYFGPGQGGDVPANIARWAAQFVMPDGTRPTPRASQVKVGDQTITRVEIGGTYIPSPMSMSGGSAPPQREGYQLLGAIIPGPDAPWFIKCTGPVKTMQANTAGFDGMLSSVQFGS